MSYELSDNFISFCEEVGLDLEFTEEGIVVTKKDIHGLPGVDLKTKLINNLKTNNLCKELKSDK